MQSESWLHSASTKKWAVMREWGREGWFTRLLDLLLTQGFDLSSQLVRSCLLRYPHASVCVCFMADCDWRLQLKTKTTHLILTFRLPRDIFTEMISQQLLLCFSSSFQDWSFVPFPVLCPNFLFLATVVQLLKHIKSKRRETRSLKLKLHSSMFLYKQVHLHGFNVDRSVF